MVTYEVKLKKIGEMTTLPDSQRLFGFLINCSKKYCTEDEISAFVKGVREQQQKCQISNLLPTGYYPNPKEYIMQKLEKRLDENRKEIKAFEEKQMNIKKESKELTQELIKKNNQKNTEENDSNKEEKKTLEKEIKSLKEKLEQKKNQFNRIADSINDLSTKHIYETLKSMDFVSQDYLKKLLELGREKETIKIKNLKKFNYVKKNQTFIQKFRLESQIKRLPGMPNVAYSLPILSFTNPSGEIQKEFSFFVKVEKGSVISNTLKEMKKSIVNDEISYFLGGKASAGYNEYRIYDIEKLNKDQDENRSIKNAVYLNLGVLLPNFDNIDAENSVLEIHTSDRKPFEIENEISKVISFVTAGSVIKMKNGNKNICKVGESIDNSKYNPLYKKNAIIFGNAYLLELEVWDED